MVRFSDLLGQGDDGDSHGGGTAATDHAPETPTPTEPVPGPPTEPPPPPPPASPPSANDLLDRLTGYAARTTTPEEDEDEAAAPSAADARLVEALRPVDDDLLPKRRSK
jgi:hypothetical protein